LAHHEWRYTHTLTLASVASPKWDDAQALLTNREGPRQRSAQIEVSHCNWRLQILNNKQIIISQ
jgi:hypothetical protein